MKAILFEATGMVGQGVLQECLGSPAVLFPRYVTTTAQMGRAMIHVAREGAPKRVLENREINEVCSEEG